MNDVWDRIETVAKGLGVKGGTMRLWKYRGYVPSKWHYQLSKEAPRFRTKLSIKEINEIQKQAPH